MCKLRRLIFVFILESEHVYHERDTVGAQVPNRINLTTAQDRSASLWVSALG